jgi:hypothetical protein
MRLIDADALMESIRKSLGIKSMTKSLLLPAERTIIDQIDSAPTVNGWISVKDGLPKEHPSLFASYYGTEKWNNAMWRTESDRVLVTILFPDGTRTVDKGKLQDGKWRTGVSPVLPQKVTHWALWPEPPKDVNQEC